MRDHALHNFSWVNSRTPEGSDEKPFNGKDSILPVEENPINPLGIVVLCENRLENIEHLLGVCQLTPLRAFVDHRSKPT